MGAIPCFDCDGGMLEARVERYDALAKMRAGIEPTFSLGKNHALRLQRLQENMAKSPSLQAAVQGDPVFAALLQARVAMHQQQITQEQNKQVGRLGAKAVLS